ncbi:MAG: L,D-transpeptidase family protein [Acidobacteria bacterium]|nr:L,D-transpeptidase family protein [Acidobacteriota bacterium]
MKKLTHTVMMIFVSIVLLAAPSCDGPVIDNSAHAPAVAPTATPTSTPIATNEMPVTLPLIDAFFFADEQFATDLKNNLQLTDEQISRLRAMAREETARLRENGDNDQSDYQGSTVAAGELAKQRVTEIIGEEKSQQLIVFVDRRWPGSVSDVVPAMTPDPTPTGSPGPTVTPSIMPESVSAPMPGNATTPTTSVFTPTDTRVVVNAPAYRLDLFKNGQLIKSYKIGIGYPEFPLPTGLRNAKSIIFNPSWTPPDEPWVESSNMVKVGEKVASGSKLNPLGVIKIPIGLPSLIHGGKATAQLGRFSSHGCVGLTNKQIQDFAKTLASLDGVELTDAEVAKHEKNRTKTESVKLSYPLPVELRYETITVEDGKLHIYRDVYERGTNTEENLRGMLAAHGVAMDQLSQDERLSVEQALKEMSRGPGGTPVEGTTPQEKEKQKQRNIERGRVTRNIEGQTEIVLEIAALAGKGYPAPLEINTGEVKKIK